MRVVVLSNEKDFQRYGFAASTRAFYQAAPERDYIIVGGMSPETMLAVRHEFTHYALHHSARPMPRWLEEGLADFYSTLEVRGGRARAGGVIDNRAKLLQTSRVMDAREVVGPSAVDAKDAEAANVPLFYANSWALVHLLRTSKQWPQLLRLLASGKGDEAALREAYGQPASQLLSEAVAGVPRLLQLEAASATAVPSVAEIATIPRDQVPLLLADAALSAGEPELAEEILRPALAGKAPTRSTAAAAGFLALKQGNRPLAMERFRFAIENGEEGAATLFEYAQLLNEMGAVREEVDGYLQRAAYARPPHPEAVFFLGTRALQRGDPRSAVVQLESAVALLPRQSVFWESLAQARLAAGDRPGAVEAARRSLEAAKTANEREAAQAALRLAEAPPTPRVETKRDALVTPEGWQPPRGDARAEGQIVEVDCLAVGGPLVVLETKQGRLRLRVSNPSRVRIIGAGGVQATLPCGPNAKRPAVRVDYRLPDDLVTLEFMQGGTGPSPPPR